MNNIAEISKNLMEKGLVNLVIGYSKISNEQRKPYFLTNPKNAEKLIFDEKCTQNLISYLHKTEIKNFNKIAIFVNIAGLRSLMQLYAENQLSNLTILPIIKDNNNFRTIEKENILEFLKNNTFESSQNNLSKITEISDLSLNDKWDFWVNTLNDCIKCYACRSACPMCYCEKCSTDCNQPQWVKTSSHSLGNLEWHIMRAMHLAGRCIECDECFRACPMDLPINLLTQKLNQDIEAQFGLIPGFSSEPNYVLSTFKFEDKESFIR